MPANDLAVGTRVRILMGNGKRVGTVKGTQLVNSTTILQRRIVVEVGGVRKTYLRSALRPLPEKSGGSDA